MGFFRRNPEEKNDVNPTMRLGLGGLVSAYLIYLGYGLVKAFIGHEEGIPGWAALLFGCLFIGAGGAYLVWALLEYRKLQAAGEETPPAEETSAEEIPAEEASVDEGPSDEAPAEAGGAEPAAVDEETAGSSGEETDPD